MPFFLSWKDEAVITSLSCLVASPLRRYAIRVRAQARQDRPAWRSGKLSSASAERILRIRLCVLGRTISAQATPAPIPGRSVKARRGTYARDELEHHGSEGRFKQWQPEAGGPDPH